MSISNADVMTPLLDCAGSLPDVRALNTLVGRESVLADAIALSNASSEVGPILQHEHDGSALGDGAVPLFSAYEPDMPVDGGGGYIEVFEPAVYAPDGFTADDLYAVEVALDPSTHQLTINLLFSTDPLDHQFSQSAASSSIAPAIEGSAINSHVGDISLDQAGTNGSRCTIVITKSTTQSGGSSTFTLSLGVVAYSRQSGGTTTTTTTTTTIEGVLQNGQCVVFNRR